MTETRTMRVSLIGCMANMARQYRERMRDIGYLLNEIKDDCEDAIVEHLGKNGDESVQETIDNFIDMKHGTESLGMMIIDDLLKARHGKFDEMEFIVCQTEDDKKALEEVMAVLH